MTPCNDSLVLPYAAYLRVYEPLSAFSEADGRRWVAYAASAGRPRGAGTLAAEHAAALRRLVSMPPVVAPEWESGDAYLRWVDGITYICPWQTRLRSWLGLSRLRTAVPQLWAAAFPAGVADEAVRCFARSRDQAVSLRIHIQACTWSVPPAWFVPFAPDERWLVLDDARDPGDGGRATAAPARSLVYATAMTEARKRVTWALDAFRSAGWPLAAGPVTGAMPLVLAELEQIGCWLDEFHPGALVELDYGGLVLLIADEALRADQSVAEVSAVVNALASGELEMAIAMYRRVTARWRELAVLDHAS